MFDKHGSRLLTEFSYRMAPSGMLRGVAHVRTDVSEEPNTSIIRVRRIGELRTTLVTAVTTLFLVHLFLSP
jgi:hypothetical protein